MQVVQDHPEFSGYNVTAGENGDTLGLMRTFTMHRRALLHNAMARGVFGSKEEAAAD